MSNYFNFFAPLADLDVSQWKRLSVEIRFERVVAGTYAPCDRIRRGELVFLVEGSARFHDGERVVTVHADSVAAQAPLNVPLHAGYPMECSSDCCLMLIPQAALEEVTRAAPNVQSPAGFRQSVVVDDDPLTLLGVSPRFKSLNTAAWAAVVRSLEIRQYEQGMPIASIDTILPASFVVLQGLVAIHRPEGAMSALLRPGDEFGDLLAAAELACPVNAKSVGKTLVAWVPRTESRPQSAEQSALPTGRTMPLFVRDPYNRFGDGPSHSPRVHAWSVSFGTRRLSPTLDYRPMVGSDDLAGVVARLLRECGLRAGIADLKGSDFRSKRHFGQGFALPAGAA